MLKVCVCNYARIEVDYPRRMYFLNFNNMLCVLRLLRQPYYCIQV